MKIRDASKIADPPKSKQVQMMKYNAIREYIVNSACKKQDDKIMEIIKKDKIITLENRAKERAESFSPKKEMSKKDKLSLKEQALDFLKYNLLNNGSKRLSKIKSKAER